MKILILGSTGLAGATFYSYLNEIGIDVFGVARNNSDFNIDISDSNALLNVLKLQHYDAIINCAANVNIDNCDKDPYKGWLINTAPLIVLSNWSKKFKIPLLQISTDHYYDYGGSMMHSETDSITLLNHYSSQKYAAEAFALTSKYALVIRTSFIGVGGKKNHLIEWAIETLTKKKKMNLFNDAWTSSIDVNSFVKYAVLLFLKKNARGIFNLASSEVFSKENLIKSLAINLNLYDENSIQSTSIKDLFPNRANCLGLDITKAETILNEKLPKMDRVVNNIANLLK